MTYLKGGYIIIKKDDANIFTNVNDALTKGKPILWYEDANTCYYIDTISKSGDDIVLTKGGKTITITDANVVTETGNISGGGAKLYTHNIDLTFLDGCDETKNIIFRVISSNESAYNDISFKALFNVGPEDQEKSCGLFNNALIETNETDNLYAFGDLMYDDGDDRFRFANNVGNSNFDVSNLTLQTITDNLVEM